MVSPNKKRPAPPPASDPNSVGASPLIQTVIVSETSTPAAAATAIAHQQQPTGEVVRKVALITGITGQDGSYLSEFLLAKGYEVHGIIRRSSSFNTGRIEHLYADPHNSKPLKLLLVRAQSIFALW